MKQLLPTLALLCLMGTVLAQPTDYYNRMKHIFGLIDKSKVNTGLLKEYGVRLNHVENYNGTIKETSKV